MSNRSLRVIADECSRDAGKQYVRTVVVVEQCLLTDGHENLIESSIGRNDRAIYGPFFGPAERLVDTWSLRAESRECDSDCRITL